MLGSKNTDSSARIAAPAIAHPTAIVVHGNTVGAIGTCGGGELHRHGGRADRTRPFRRYPRTAEEASCELRDFRAHLDSCPGAPPDLLSYLRWMECRWWPVRRWARSVPPIADVIMRRLDNDVVVIGASEAARRRDNRATRNFQTIGRKRSVLEGLGAR